MGKLFLILTAMLLVFSCTKKQGRTTSKIKLFGGNVFSGGGTLSVKANNGLILYGKSDTGKSFARKIDSDTLDIDLPNGAWGLFAVSWEQGTPLSAFQGKTYCGKAKNILLSGSETSINLNLTNANCNDPDFSALTSTVGGDQRLPFKQIVSCRDLSNISSYANDCLRTNDLSTSNKGFITFVKILAPQYTNFGNGFVPNGAPIESGCIEIDKTSLSGSVNMTQTIQTSGTIIPDILSLPDSGNGLGYIARVYHSRTPCDDAEGFNDLPISNDNLGSKKFGSVPTVSIISKEKVFIRSGEGLACQPPRLNVSHDFAGGRGTPGNPYIICNADQFNRIQPMLGDASFPSDHASFEFGGDLDFNQSPILPIGNQVNTTSTIAYGGLNSSNYTILEGNGHSMNKVFVQCNNTATDDLGIIRKAQYLKIQNIITRENVFVCPLGSNVGGLVGLGTDVHFKNVLVSGHIEGSSEVGGLIGNVDTLVNVETSHVVGDIRANGSEGGGIIGRAINLTTGLISKSSYSGNINVTNNVAGGLVGALYSPSVSFTITESLAKIKMNATQNLGGLIGVINVAPLVVLNDNYVKGSIRATTNPGRIGGIAGYKDVTNLQVNRGYVEVKKIGLPADATLLPAYGYDNGGTATCIDYAVWDDGTGNVGTACNGSTFVKNKSLLNSAMATMQLANSSLWYSTNGDLPRLTMETPASTTVKHLGPTGCEGNYSAQFGAGTLLDPKILCSQTQFQAMVPGDIYALKEDLFFEGTSTPFVAGNYFLNGNKNTVHNLMLAIPGTLTNNFGLFTELSGLSKIKNIRFFGATAVNTTSVSFSGVGSAGLIAGKNHGDIQGVSLEASEFKYKNDTGSTAVFNLGLVAGTNDGLISEANINGSIIAGAPFMSGQLADTSTKQWGTIVGRNITPGLISKINNSAKMEIGHTVSFSGTHRYGGIVGENTGTIEEVKMQGATTVNGFSGYAANAIYSPLAVLNSGTIRDVEYKAYVSTVNTTHNGAVSNNAGGFIKRVIFAPSNINGYVPSFDLGGGTVLESFCIYSVANCYVAGTGFGFTDPSFTVSSALYSGTPVDLRPNNSAEWSMTAAAMPEDNFVWQFTSSSTPPGLLRTEAKTAEFTEAFN